MVLYGSADEVEPGLDIADSEVVVVGGGLVIIRDGHTTLCLFSIFDHRSNCP